MTVAMVMLAERVRLDGVVLIGLIVPLGASAVLVLGMPAASVSQPRRLLGGHGLGALVGVAADRLPGAGLPLAAGVGVAGALAVMEITRTLHPPAGGSALLAVIGGDQVHALGFAYVLVPVLAGAVVLLAVAVAVSAAGGRSYPVSCGDERRDDRGIPGRARRA